MKNILDFSNYKFVKYARIRLLSYYIFRFWFFCSAYNILLVLLKEDNYLIKVVSITGNTTDNIVTEVNLNMSAIEIKANVSVSEYCVT